MEAATKYAFLHGRVSVLASQLVAPERLAQLLEDGGDQEAVLAEAGLGSVTERKPTNAEELEQVLASVVIDETVRLGRGLQPAGRDLIHHFARRFEISNLKILLRCKRAGCEPDEIRARLFDLAPLPTDDVEQLLRAEDTNEFLRLLEHGRYGSLAHQLRQVITESQEVFLLEAAIDYGHFSALARLVSQLPASDRALVQPFVARVIDQINVIWLMRYRLGYGITPPHAYFLLVRTSGQLDRARLAAIARLDTLDAMIQALPAPLSTVLEGAETVSEVEERFIHQRLIHADHVLHNSTFNLARALAYLALREQQIRRVHATLKGRMLDLPRPVIRRAAGFDVSEEAV